MVFVEKKTQKPQMDGTDCTSSFPAPVISPGDNAWMLASCALVMLMTPGLGFFYGGELIFFPRVPKNLIFPFGEIIRPSNTVVQRFKVTYKRGQIRCFRGVSGVFHARSRGYLEVCGCGVEIDDGFFLSFFFLFFSFFFFLPKRPPNL